jgi:hypothetical protein
MSRSAELNALACGHEHQKSSNSSPKGDDANVARSKNMQDMLVPQRWRVHHKGRNLNTRQNTNTTLPFPETVSEGHMSLQS